MSEKEFYKDIDWGMDWAKEQSDGGDLNELE